MGGHRTNNLVNIDSRNNKHILSIHSMKYKCIIYKDTNTNIWIKNIYIYMDTNTNIWVKIHIYMDTNTNIWVKIHIYRYNYKYMDNKYIYIYGYKYVYVDTNTYIWIQIQIYRDTKTNIQTSIVINFQF